jgi:hypothetical protein
VARKEGRHLRLWGICLRVWSVFMSG